MVAELNLKGVLTGTVEVGTDVDYEIKGTVTLNKHGDADVNLGCCSGD